MPTTPPPATPASPPARTPEPPPGGLDPARGRLRGLGSVAGLAISAVALAAVVWWALRQGKPQLPHTAGQIAALVAAILLYGFNTLVRSERWHRLAVDDGGHSHPGAPHSQSPGRDARYNARPGRAGRAPRAMPPAAPPAARRR